MTWACVNGHRVQEGMFVCPACGSDELRERSGVSAHAAVATAPPAEEPPAGPTAALRFNMWLGIAFLAGGFSAVGPLLEGTSEQDLSAYFQAILALVGCGLLLVAIVGWGVKLGIEAAREAAREGAAADVPEGAPTAH